MLKVYFQGRETGLFNKVPKLLCLLYIKILYRIRDTLKRQCYCIIRDFNICMYFGKFPGELIGGVPCHAEFLFCTDSELALTAVVLFKGNFKKEII